MSLFTSSVLGGVISHERLIRLSWNLQGCSIHVFLCNEPKDKINFNFSLRYRVLNGGVGYRNFKIMEKVNFEQNTCSDCLVFSSLHRIQCNWARGWKWSQSDKWLLRYLPSKILLTSSHFFGFWRQILLSAKFFHWNVIFELVLIYP